MTPHLDASARILYEEAQQLGITCTTFGDNNLILMEKNGKQWYTRGSRTSLQSSVGKTIADNKALTKKILHHYNLPTAQSVTVFSESELERVSELAFPVVMKPLDARHGAGVIVGIKTQAEAEGRYRNSEYPKVIFEEMLEGVEYRVVVVNFKFVAATFRKPAHVVGDGVSSIEQLIAEKNQHPWRGKGHTANMTFIEVDELVESYLREQGLSVTSVPAKDQEVMLRKTANLSTGGEAWDVSDEVSDENKALFEQIARACDLNTVGIDIMCQSLQEPLTQQPKAGVIEVNASPGLRMHHYPLVGKPRNVARAILEMVLNH